MNVMPTVPVLLQDQEIAFSLWSAGTDSELLVHSFSVSEQVFGLSQINVELASDDADIDLQAVLDAPATLSVHHKYEGVRHFSGVVAAISRGDEGFHRTMYSLTILPMLHRLAHGSDCRIFQQKNVVDIIKEILKEGGIEDVEWHLSGKTNYQSREYCVQYRESHLVFVERLASEEGLWYYFTYGKNGQHTLHFCDLNYIVPDLPDQPNLEYNSMPGGAVTGVFCHNFRYQEQIRSTSFTNRDYFFTNPPYNQEHRHNKQEDNGSSRDYDLFDYPGRYKFDASGKPFTQYRMEANRVDASTANGTTNAIHLMPGHKMEITEHPKADWNIKYHLLGVSHHGSQPQALKEEAGEGATTYTASFHAMPARLPYRPPQRHKPFVEGVQQAKVVGPEGEEIYTDEHGRVKVRFFWDRYSKEDENSTCWIRVSSNWAGTQWGHVSTPRIGQEVVVSYFDGDPDQPIITGRTFNARNQFPYKLPDHKTKMVLRSDSHKADGYNEISFEDEGGQENMFFHAQKDMTFKVLNNRAKRVENNQVESVGSNKSIEVGANHQEKIGGSMNISVGGGSGGALMGALGAVLAGGGKDMVAGANASGNPAVGTFAAGIAAAGAIAEGASLSGKGAFNAAGGHFTEAGKAQQGTASALGGILSKIMPMGGIVNAVIEKFQTTTVGIASTEQIGAMKNTSVGHTMTTNVGMHKKITVGEDLIIEVGKSVLVMKKNGTIVLKGVKVNVDGDKHVQVNSKIIDLN